MDAFLSAPLKENKGPVSPLSLAYAFRHLPVLETDRLILRKVRRSDADDLFAYARDPEVSRHVLWTAHQSKADSRYFLSQLRRQYRMGWPPTFGIEEKATGRLVGTIGFMQVSSEHACAEVGYSPSRDCWNRGLMTEALDAVLRYAFTTLALNRVEAMHETDNPASGRVMEKNGMRPEGVFRSRIYNKTHYSDVRVWAILREDWLLREEKKHVQL